MLGPNIMSFCNSSGGGAVWTKLPSYAYQQKNTQGYTLLGGTGIGTSADLYYITSSASLYNSIYSGSTVQAPAILQAVIMKIS